MDVSLVIKQRLSELGLDQRDLASATQVTESYVSQLLTRKKAPPAPGRTDIYDKIGEFLKLPAGELSRLANLQRQEELKKRVIAPPRPLFKECRDLILRKCEPNREREIRRIFEKEPFGEFERLVTQKLLDVAQSVAKEELSSGEWLELMAQVSGRSYENCVSFLDQVIDSWDMDLRTFGIEVVLNHRQAPGSRKRFEFVEQEPQQSFALEPGFEQFLNDTSLSGDATEEEIEFLKTLNFKGRRPGAMYYYRELQSLRDPLHFPAPL
jgi:transcriptional regulator with XRE-family HTH domain